MRSKGHIISDTIEKAVIESHEVTSPANDDHNFNFHLGM